MSMKKLILDSNFAVNSGLSVTKEADGDLYRRSVHHTGTAYSAPFVQHQKRMFDDLPDNIIKLSVEAQFNFTNPHNDPFLDGLEEQIRYRRSGFQLDINLILADPIRHADRFIRATQIPELGGVQYPEEMLKVQEYSFGNLNFESVGPRQVRHAYRHATELQFQTVQRVGQLLELAAENGVEMRLMFVPKVKRPAIKMTGWDAYGVHETLIEGFYDLAIESQENYGYLTENTGTIMAFEQSLRFPKKEIDAKDRLARVNDPWELANALMKGNQWAPLPPDPWTWGPGD